MENLLLFLVDEQINLYNGFGSRYFFGFLALLLLVFCLCSGFDLLMVTGTAVHLVDLG